MITDIKVAFPKVEFAMRCVQDGNVMNEVELLRKGNSDLSAQVMPHPVFLLRLF